jgi:glycosyltransferase involved in cell wall biosynthesis
MNQLVSVVIPAYKSAYLFDAISSVLSQTYKNLELIIVNDASPEDITSLNVFRISKQPKITRNIQA